MEYIILIAIFIGVVVGCLFFLIPTSDNQTEDKDKDKRNTNEHNTHPHGQYASEEKWPFYPSYAMTRNEQQLYWKLTSALPDYIVLAQVQASRILKIKKSANPQYWFNRVNRMSYDYVICHKNSYPLAVIELDDSSHERAERQEADSRKNKILNDAGLTLFRWQQQTIPDSAAIAELIRQIDVEQQQRRQQFHASKSN